MIPDPLACADLIGHPVNCHVIHGLLLLLLLLVLNRLQQHQRRSGKASMSSIYLSSGVDCHRYDRTGRYKALNVGISIFSIYFSSSIASCVCVRGGYTHLSAGRHPSFSLNTQHDIVHFAVY